MAFLLLRDDILLLRDSIFFIKRRTSPLRHPPRGRPRGPNPSRRFTAPTSSSPPPPQVVGTGQSLCSSAAAGPLPPFVRRSWRGPVDSGGSPSGCARSGRRGWPAGWRTEARARVGVGARARIWCVARIRWWAGTVELLYSGATGAELVCAVERCGQRGVAGGGASRCGLCAWWSRGTRARRAGRAPAGLAEGLPPGGLWHGRRRAR